MKKLTFISKDNLAGTNFAIQEDEKVYVSPAIYKLLVEAEDDYEVTHLLKNLECYLLSG